MCVTEVVAATDPYRRLQPLWGWARTKAPGCWKGHNNIKHSEYEYANHGNLQNAPNFFADLDLVLKRSINNEKGSRPSSPWAAPGTLTSHPCSVASDYFGPAFADRLEGLELPDLPA
jgi:hypothetical protein